MFEQVINVGTEWSEWIPSEIKIIQIISLLAVLYYGVKSGKVLIKGLKEEYKQQGILPVLGIVYLFISAYFILKFIWYFNAIYLANTVALLDSSQYYISNFQLVDSIFDYSILFLLLAFTVNFSKAIFTMNSLEFGILIKDNYGKNIYQKNNKKTVVLDTVVRLLIALFFVLLENRLSNSNHLFSENDLSSFVVTGFFSLSLYTSAIIWLIHNNELDRKTDKVLNVYWMTFTSVQFICGLGISIFLILIGYSHNDPDYSTLGLLYSGAIGLFSFFLLLSVAMNEFKPSRYYV